MERLGGAWEELRRVLEEVLGVLGGLGRLLVARVAQGWPKGVRDQVEMVFRDPLLGGSGGKISGGVLIGSNEFDRGCSPRFRRKRWRRRTS